MSISKCHLAPGRAEAAVFKMKTHLGASPPKSLVLPSPRPQTALLGGWLSATRILDALLAFIPNFTFPLTMSHGLVDFSARLKVGLDALRGFCQPERVCDWDNPSHKAEPRGDESSDAASPDNPPSLRCKLRLGSWCQLGNHSLAYLFIFPTTCSLR